MDGAGERPEDPTSPPRWFRVDREELDDRIEVRIVGDLDMATALELRVALQPDDARPIVIDLAETTFMDSSGLNALVAAWHLGTVVAVRHPSPIVQRAIEISGLGKVLSIET
jgi:stage II sporulation protein AA (anti-sigma F factor antagonist)